MELPSKPGGRIYGILEVFHTMWLHIEKKGIKVLLHEFFPALNEAFLLTFTRHTVYFCECSQSKNKYEIHKTNPVVPKRIFTDESRTAKSRSGFVPKARSLHYVAISLI